jgi:glycosyltransferase involved in cell wall biosynthesis
METQPKLSIITCTYNSEVHLPKALASIEQQTFRDFEHVINDSYSSDATLQIIEDYIQRNKGAYPIRVIQSPACGVANALNVATQEARGEFIHFLHSDDYYYEKDSLKDAMSYFEQNPDLVWLTGNFLIDIQGKLVVLPQTHLLNIHLEKSLSCMNIISHENTFVKTQAVRDYGGFDEAKNFVVEYRLWLRLIKDHQPLIVNDEFTVFIINRGSTSTGSPFKLFKAVLRAFHSQRKEKVIPMIGYYQEKKVFAFYKKLARFMQEVARLFGFGKRLG